jgi:hypothetical protein
MSCLAAIKKFGLDWKSLVSFYWKNGGIRHRIEKGFRNSAALGRCITDCLAKLAQCFPCGSRFNGHCQEWVDLMFSKKPEKMAV